MAEIVYKNYTLVILLILFVFIFIRLNLCRKNAKETTELCYKIKDLYRTYLSNGSPEFYEVALNTLNAIWYIDITSDIDSFMAFAYKLHGLPGKYLIFALIRNFYFDNFYLLFFFYK